MRGLSRQWPSRRALAVLKKTRAARTVYVNTQRAHSTHLRHAGASTGKSGRKGRGGRALSESEVSSGHAPSQSATTVRSSTTEWQAPRLRRCSCALAPSRPRSASLPARVSIVFELIPGTLLPPRGPQAALECSDSSDRVPRDTPTAVRVQASADRDGSIFGRRTDAAPAVQAARLQRTRRGGERVQRRVGDSACVGERDDLGPAACPARRSH